MVLCNYVFIIYCKTIRPEKPRSNLIGFKRCGHHPASRASFITFLSGQSICKVRSLCLQVCGHEQVF